MSPSHVSLPLYGLQYFSVGHELVLLTLSCLLSFFHFFNVSSMGLSYAIHRNHMSTPHTHPWEPARPCPWEPRITPLFSTISNIPLLGFFFFFSFSRFFVCGPFKAFSIPARWDHEHLTTFAAHHHGL